MVPFFWNSLIFDYFKTNLSLKINNIKYKLFPFDWSDALKKENKKINNKNINNKNISDRNINNKNINNKNINNNKGKVKSSGNKGFASKINQKQMLENELEDDYLYDEEDNEYDEENEENEDYYDDKKNIINIF